MKDVAVIIINYNSSKYTLECIQSIVKHTSKSISKEIIVVDNSSEFPDYYNLRDNLPQDSDIKLVRSDVNTGFGGGNMHGANLANARYLLFFNNDALLLNDAIQIMTEFMDKHEQAGVCTAQNYDSNKNHVPSFDHDKGLRRFLFGRGFLESLNPKRYPKRKMEYAQPLSIDWVNGACMFFRSEVFIKVEGFDPSIFLYWEEMDICHRLRKSNYQSYLVPQAKILHYQGMSIGQSKEINKESYRSYLYVVKKNHGALKWLLIKVYLALVILFKPNKWYLYDVILKRNELKDSLKHHQVNRTLDES